MELQKLKCGRLEPLGIFLEQDVQSSATYCRELIEEYQSHPDITHTLVYMSPGESVNVLADENGNAICVDTSFADKLYCSWTPAWTGPFIIAVKNQGRIRNTYYILTN